MKAIDIATAGAATVHPEAPLSEAARIMLDHNVSGLPVINHDGKLVGMLTERDFIRQDNRFRPRWIDVLMGDRSGDTAAAQLHTRRVEDRMTRNPITIGPETPLPEVIEIMEQQNVKRLPVVANQVVVGIVSRSDVLRALLRTSNRSSLGSVR